MNDLHSLPLHDLHVELGAKMVPFAGYEMPVQYAAGVMKEHLHTRDAAGLFDVSHMGQVILRGDTAARDFETMMPVNVMGLKEGRQRYGLLTNDAGGILDDLMFANRGDHLFVVVNAACKQADLALGGRRPIKTLVLVVGLVLIVLAGAALVLSGRSPISIP